VEIPADQCQPHLAAERIRLGDALYRQEYFGAFISAPGSVFDSEVLAHMFGDDAEDEADEAPAVLRRRSLGGREHGRFSPGSQGPHFPTD